MLGVVFTEFLDMVETQFSAEVVDDIIDDAGVAGAYTAVGNYPLKDMVALVVALSRRADLPIPALLTAFGEHLFGVFSRRYGALFTDVSDSLTFIAGIEDRIHTEVRKLYPDADLPRFDIMEREADRLVVQYRSVKCLGDLALGLIRGCGAHFGERLAVTASPDSHGPEVMLTITRLPDPAS